jgi:hypothetical protein
MSKQAAPATPKLPAAPAIAPRVSVGGPAARVTGAAGAAEVAASSGGRAAPVIPRAAETTKAAGDAPRVTKWGNGAPEGRAAPDDLPPTAALNDQTGGVEGAAANKPGKVAEEGGGAGAAAAGGDKGAGDSETPAAAAKPSGAERRGSVIANLEAERERRVLEQTLKAAQPRVARADELENVLKNGSLEDRLKLLGVDHEELLEKLLTKDKALGASPQKPAAAGEEPAYVKALRETVEDLKKRLDGRDGNDEQAQIARATAGVAEQLKDKPDLDLTNSMPDGHGLVLRVGYQMWLDSGKNGHPRDYTERASKNVEAHLREKHPSLAALADKAKGAGGAAAAGGGGGGEEGGGPSLGRRGSRGAGGKLPDLSKLTREEKDLAIKKEMGWD